MKTFRVGRDVMKAVLMDMRPVPIVPPDHVITFCNIPVRLDPSMRRDEIRIEHNDGHSITVTGISQ